MVHIMMVVAILMLKIEQIKNEQSAKCESLSAENFLFSHPMIGQFQ